MQLFKFSDCTLVSRCSVRHGQFARKSTTLRRADKLMTSSPACSIDWARTIHLRLMLPVQILTATSETFASRPLCMRSVMCLTASTLLDRHASLGRHVAPHCSAHFAYLCLFLSVSLLVTPTPIWPHFGVGRLHTLYPVNREAIPLAKRLHSLLNMYISFH